MSKWLRTIVVLGLVVGFFTHTLAIAAPTVATPAPQKKKGILTNGYIDLQYRLGHGNLDLNGTSFKQGEGSTFLVNKGAIMLTDTFDNSELVVDIPFEQSPNVATDNNDLVLGTKEAQAYVAYKVTPHILLKVGQFDSPYGTEGNDTTSIAFPRHGIMRSFVTKTHTGLLVEWKPSSFGIAAVAGNSRGTGLQHDNASGQFGLLGTWELSNLKIAVGGLYDRINGNYPLNGTTESSYEGRVLFHSKAELRVDKFLINGELNLANSGMPKAGIGGLVKDHDMVQGFLIQGLYTFDESWLAGVRYEYLTNDGTNEFVQALPQNTGNTPTGQGGHLSKMSFTIGKVINQQLFAKLGLDMNSVKVGSDVVGKTQAFTTGAASLLYTF